jgi:hypothetical protein
VREVYTAEGPWPQRTRNALAATLEWFAADPDVARFALVELSAIGPAFRPRFTAEFARAVAIFREGLEEGGVEPELPQATELAVGAILARIYEETVLGRAAELPRLLPDLTYELLVPFLGEEQARAAAESAEPS